MTFEVTEEGNGCAGMLAFGSDRGRGGGGPQHQAPLHAADVTANGGGIEEEVDGAGGPGGEEFAALAAPPPTPSETPLPIEDTTADGDVAATARPVRLSTVLSGVVQPRRGLLLREPPPAALTSLTATPAVPSSHVSGLKNLGNTCYANSILQALYSLSKIRRHFYHLDDDDGGGPFHRILSRLFAEMRKCNRNQGILSQVCSFGAVKPVEFCREFRKAKPQFRRNEQQDAQEFLSLLLDLLHDECNKAKKASKKEEKGEILYETPSQPPPQPPPPPPPATPSEPSNAEEAWEQHVTNVDNSFFSKLLMGQSESCLTCQTCGNSSISWSSFWQLPLAVQKEKKKTSTVAAVAGEEAAANGSSVAEQGEQKEPTLTLANCISEFMETEILSDDCAPLCEKCNRREPASKKLTIVRSPRYLILHLKRFDENGTKITRPVTISSHLRLAGLKYRLRCCVLHRGGEVFQGHYTTLIAEKEQAPVPAAPDLSLSTRPSKRQSLWMLADDDAITPGISEERALNCMKRYAYIAVYQAESAGGGKSSSDKVKGSSVPVDKLPEEQQPEEEVLVQLAQQLEIEDKVHQQQEPKEEVLVQLLQPEEEVLVQQQPKNEVLEEEETVSSQLL